jgi:hypothetical protein
LLLISTTNVETSFHAVRKALDARSVCPSVDDLEKVGGTRGLRLLDPFGVVFSLPPILADCPCLMSELPLAFSLGELGNQFQGLGNY